MANKSKLLKILKALSPDKLSADFAQFDSEVERLKNALKEKVQAQTLEDVNIQLEKFKNKIDLKPIREAMVNLEADLDQKIKGVAGLISDENSQIEKLMASTKQEAKDQILAIASNVEVLKKELAVLESNKSTELNGIKDKLTQLFDFNLSANDTVNELTQSVDKIRKDKSLKNDLDDNIALLAKRMEDLRKEFLTRINNIGGGSPNQKISINSSVMSLKYADINLKGSITKADNDTTKEVDITFAGGGGTPGGSDTEVQFNDGGDFGGDANFTWDKTNNNLTVSKINNVRVVDGVLFATSGAGIQAAIDDLPAGGGTVFIPAGTYTVSAPITVPSNVTLEGEGYATYIVAATALNDNVIENDDAVGGNTQIILKNLRVDGNKANQTVAFNTVYMEKVTYSIFENLWVSNALRTGTFPTVSSLGEGLRLTGDSNYNQVIGGYYYDNSYDGIKIRETSNWNTITGATFVNNGRAGVQISGTSSSETANYNTISNCIVYHPTGTPSASSPTTSGVYIHGGRYNTCSNNNIYGVRQGYATNDSSDDNVFTGGTIRINYSDKACIEIEPDTAGVQSSRNIFSNIDIRGLTGSNGEFFTHNGRGDFNKIQNCVFSIGAGTGTWTFNINSGANDTTLMHNSATNFSLSNSGTRSIVVWDNAGLVTHAVGDVEVPDEAYGVAWNGSLEVPTKNALYDKIETIAAGGITRSISSVATSQTMGADAGTDYVYIATAGIALTLPTAVGNSNLYTVKNVSASSILVATTSAQTIDTDANLIISTQFAAVDLVNDGADNWSIT